MDSPLFHINPTALPFSSTSILSAAGLFGNPGIVMIAPVKQTRKPAPIFGITSLTVIENPLGRPINLGSSVS